MPTNYETMPTIFKPYVIETLKGGWAYSNSRDTLEEAITLVQQLNQYDKLQQHRIIYQGEVVFPEGFIDVNAGWDFDE